MLILWDGLTAADLTSPAAPHLAALARRGAVAVVNASPATGASDGTVALACGEHVATEAGDGLFMDSAEPAPVWSGTAGDVYLQRTLRNAPPDSIVGLGIASLERRGIAGRTTGAALSAAGIAAAVFGNADTSTPDRSAALLASSADGTAIGEVAVSRSDPAAPFGRRDAVEALARAAEGRAGLVVLRCGDSVRAAEAPGLAGAARGDARAEALDELDALVGRIASDASTDVIVAPPAMFRSAALPGGWRPLGATAAVGPDFRPGLLESPTTRTPGLVATIDIAPTILAMLGVQAPAAMVGRAATVTRRPADPAAAAYDLDRQWTLTARASSTVGPAVGAICLALVIFVLRFRGTPRIAPAARFAGLAAAAFPIACLAQFGPPPQTLAILGARIVLWMAICALAALAAARLLRTDPAATLAAIGVAAITADLVTGGRFVAGSMLSAYAISGIRFYGAGNEYLGILVGLALTLTAAPAARRRWALVGAVWLGALVLLAAPGAGANSGSAIVCGAAFAAAAAASAGRRPGWYAAGGAVAGMGVAILLALDDAGSATPTHAGLAIHAAEHGRGIAYLAAIVARKAVMSARLGTSPWLLLAAGAVAAVLVLAGTPGGPLRRLVSSTAGGRVVTAGTLAGGAAALLSKDSGIVTAVFLVGTVVVFAIAGAPPVGAVGAPVHEGEPV